MGFNADILTQLNATLTAALGDAGTYVQAASETEYAVDVVLDDRTGAIDDGLGATIETRPTAVIDAAAIPEPARHDRVIVAGVTYRVDAWQRDRGLYRLELRYEGGL